MEHSKRVQMQETRSPILATFHCRYCYCYLITDLNWELAREACNKHNTKADHYDRDDSRGVCVCVKERETDRDGEEREIGRGERG